MIRWMFLSTLLILSPFYFSNMSCTDEGKIGAAFHDGEELQEGDQIPFRLHQNYPNPFNPSTTIQFDTGMEMHVTLKVYSEDWLEVETLIDDMKVAGQHLVEFNASTDLPSGEYYYTMEALGYTVVRKMMLIK